MIDEQVPILCVCFEVVVFVCIWLPFACLWRFLMAAIDAALYVYRYCCSLTSKTFSKKQFPEGEAKIDFVDYEAQTIQVNKLKDDRTEKTEIEDEIDVDVLSELCIHNESISERTPVKVENGKESCNDQPVRTKKANFIHGSLVMIDDDADKAPPAGKRRHSIGASSTDFLTKVTNTEVKDWNGEKGSYTGSVCSSSASRAIGFGRAGRPHGFGRIEYERGGRWYEGDWKHGSWYGHGKFANGCGDLYEGGFRCNSKHGHGVMKFADGRTFDCEYVYGQMIYGQMKYKDGSVCKGSSTGGMRHGFGKCIFPDGSVYEGEFRDGEFNGLGQMLLNNGSWYEGNFKNSQMHGHGIEIRSDGTVRHDGEWYLGKPINNEKG